jgi:hypothetical protein
VNLRYRRPLRGRSMLANERARVLTEVERVSLRVVLFGLKVPLVIRYQYNIGLFSR